VKNFSSSSSSLPDLRDLFSTSCLPCRVNVGCGPAEERVLLTGLHAVADIYCENCKTTLGWKYEHAFESSQKYKEGKFIIELAHMIKDNGWE
ncbi:protein yippee-like 1, partial [Epinephelus moara]|uniref:protein yippee-like 1 n=1 Tax=Epinephelus moara TaxID=300413 RepID=UPI00214EDABB